MVLLMVPAVAACLGVRGLAPPGRGDRVPFVEEQVRHLDALFDQAAGVVQHRQHMLGFPRRHA